MSKTEIKKKKKKIDKDADFEKEIQEDIVDKNKVKEMLMSKMKKKESEMVELIQKQDRALNWFVVGCGQGGSRIAETFYNLKDELGHNCGYESVAINTAKQDLEHIDIPEQNKLLLQNVLDGAGKDLSVGEDAFNNGFNDVCAFIQEKVPKDTDMFILSITGGGGTGSGSAESMISILQEYNAPIIVLYVLPLESDDVTAKNNSLITLSKLAKMAQNDTINSLAIVDNAKLETFPSLKQGNFWKEANRAIVEPLHMFNTLSVCSSNYTSLDPSDTGKILTAGDCCIYGQIEVKDFMEETSLAEAVLESLESGLLASGFNLKESRSAGIIIRGAKDVLAKIPAVNINYAYAVLNEVTDNATIYKGMYDGDVKEDRVQVYTIFSGLGLPQERIERLKAEAQKRMNAYNQKDDNRKQSMEMDYNQSNVTDTVQKIHQKIKKSKSAFGKLTSNKGIIDRRRR